MLSKKNSMVTMVTDEFLENRIILQKSVATIGFIWFFLIPEMYTFVHFCASLLSNEIQKKPHFPFRLGFTPTLSILRFSTLFLGFQQKLQIEKEYSFKFYS